MEVSIRNNSRQKKSPAMARSVFVEPKFLNNARNSAGETPLHSLAKYQLKFSCQDKNCTKERKGKVQRGEREEPCLKDYPKAGLMLYAISCGSGEVDVKDHLGRTPLMNAVAVSEEVSLIGLLLDANASIYVTDFEGASALKMVIEKSRSWLASLKPSDNRLVILSLFFEKVRNDFYVDRALALQRLQSVGCPRALVPFIKSTRVRRYLLENNLELEERLSGLTALHVAVMSQDIVSVKLLVNLGENLNAVDGRKQNVLFAHDNSGFGGAERFAILRTLLNRGASLYRARNDGTTPMEYLLKDGYVPTVWTVLESNANLLDRCEPNGETALHFLVRNENFFYTPWDEIRLLLRKGFDVNVTDRRGVSALTYAIRHENEEVIKCLLTVGARANWIEIVENTPVLDCFMNGYYERAKTEYYQWVVQLIFLQQGINVRALFDELNTGFIRKLDNVFYGQIVIAQLVIAEAAGQGIPESTLEFIVSEIVFKVHYDICKARLEEMKSIVVYDSLSLYDVLTESDDKIDRYVCNADFLGELEFVTSEKTYHNVYYVVIARKRIENAVKIKELREKSGLVVSECTGLNFYGISEDHCVASKIVGYLSNRDIQNLFGGQWLPKEIPMAPSRTPNVGGNIFSRALRKFFARTDE